MIAVVGSLPLGAEEQRLLRQPERRQGNGRPAETGTGLNKTHAAGSCARAAPSALGLAPRLAHEVEAAPSHLLAVQGAARWVQWSL